MIRLRVAAGKVALMAARSDRSISGREASHRAVIVLSAAIEVVTGAVLLAIPATVVEALIGPPSGDTTSVVARVLGGALLSLGVVGITARRTAGRGLTVAYIVYDVASVGVLASAGISGTASGRLLWPVVAVHSLLAIALVIALLRTSWRPEQPPADRCPSE